MDIKISSLASNPGKLTSGNSESEDCADKPKNKERKKKDILATVRCRKVNNLKKELSSDIRSEIDFKEHSLALILKVMDSFFCFIHDSLNSLPDRRAPNKKYSLANLFFPIILNFILKKGSINNLCDSHKNKHGFNDEVFRINIKNIFGIELASANRLRSICTEIDPTEFRNVLIEFIRSLNDKKYLKKFSYIDGYLIMTSDGSAISKSKTFGELSIKIKKTSVDKVTGEEKVTITYKRSRVEFRFCLKNGMSPLIHEEWIAGEYNNESEDKIKQDCEQKAYKRGIDTISKIITGGTKVLSVSDGIQTNGPSMRICLDKGWDFLFSLKNKDLKSIWDIVYQRLGVPRSVRQRDLISYLLTQKEITPDVVKDEAKIITKKKLIKYPDKEEMITSFYLYVNDVKFQDISLNWISVTEVNGNSSDTKDKTFFAFVTSCDIDSKNVEDFIHAGRNARAASEDCFNTEKNRGYEAKHQYSRKSGIGAENFATMMHMAEFVNMIVQQSDEFQANIKAESKLAVSAIWEKLRAFLTDSVVSVSSLKKTINLIPNNFTFKIMSAAYDKSHSKLKSEQIPSPPPPAPLLLPAPKQNKMIPLPSAIPSSPTPLSLPILEALKFLEQHQTILLTSPKSSPLLLPAPKQDQILPSQTTIPSPLPVPKQSQVPLPPLPLIALSIKETISSLVSKQYQDQRQKYRLPPVFLLLNSLLPLGSKQQNENRILPFLKYVLCTSGTVLTCKLNNFKTDLKCSHKYMNAFIDDYIISINECDNHLVNISLQVVTFLSLQKIFELFLNDHFVVIFYIMYTRINPIRAG